MVWISSKATLTYDLKVFEERIEVASAKVGNWSPPIRRVGRSIADITWNGVSRPVPDFDTAAGPFQRKNPAVVQIERRAVAGADIGHNCAAVIPSTRTAFGAGPGAASLSTRADIYIAS